MKTHQYSCNELGLCQHRNPSCSGCTWKTDPKVFAPGTIEGPFTASRYRLYFAQTVRLIARHMTVIGPTLLVVAVFSGVIARKLGWV